MGFLGIGAMEAVVIIVIALIIFGPGRLPEIMGEAGRAVRDFRRATQDLTADFRESYDEVRGTVDELQSDMRQTARELESETQSIARSINETVQDAGKIDAPASKKRSAPRPAQKLDQLPADEDEAVETATEAPAATPPKAAPKAQPASTPAGSDDLLAADDGLAGDDLLTADADADDLLSMNGASAQQSSEGSN